VRTAPPFAWAQDWVPLQSPVAEGNTCSIPSGRVVATAHPRSRLHQFSGLARLSGLSQRDASARAQLEMAARPNRPAVPAVERVLPVPAPLGELLPGCGVRRGAVVTVTGSPGSGATSLAFTLAAAATAAGEWAGMVDRDGTAGALAAADAGVALDRFVVVRRIPRARWVAAVAALLDGTALVIAEVPRRITVGDARRLAARARERGAVLVPLVTDRRAAWPAEAAVRLQATGGVWPGLGEGTGRLEPRALGVAVETHGVARAGLLRAG
jgi:hypothetical protein